MNKILQAEPLSIPDTPALRFLPEGPMALSDSLVSWVGIQHGSESTVGSLNLLDLKTNTNQSFELPGRPGFAFPTSKENLFVVGCERSLGLFDLSDGSWNVLIDGVDAVLFL